ncbi:MAG: CHRD domain-containing protein [Myxococcales bacterium]|nr:CHRD domain-containing protein [Myxococcota bacterium]MDW8282482.1 CHRD domain-containing protein [Myxococcales bacterium]
MRLASLAVLVPLLFGCLEDTPGYCERDEDCGANEFCRLPARSCAVGMRKIRCQTDADCQKINPNQLCLAPDCVDAIARGFFSGAQVVPPTCSPAEGTILFHLKPNNTELVYSLTHSVENPLAVRIHAGKQGETGLPIFELEKESGIVRTIRIAPDQLDELVKGNFYVNITSSSLPAGEVRAQIYSLLPGQSAGPKEFFAHLTPLQTPRVVRSMASGEAYISIDEGNGSIFYLIGHNLDNPISGIHIHRGSFNNEGPHIVDLPNDAPPEGVLSRSDIFAAERAFWPLLFKAGLAYFNFHTMNQSSGELRGQLLPYRTMPFAVAVPFNVKLEPEQVVAMSPVTSAAAGTAAFFLNADRTKLTWRLVHDALEPTGAKIYKGVRGQNGVAVCDLGPGTTKSQGTCDVKASGGPNDLIVDDLLRPGGGLYIQIQTRANPMGELRGQLVVPR